MIQHFRNVESNAAAATVQQGRLMLTLGSVGFRLRISQSLSTRNGTPSTTGGSRAIEVGNRRHRIGVQRIVGNGSVASEFHRSMLFEWFLALLLYLFLGSCVRFSC